MATPQRSFPDEPRPELQRVEPRRVEEGAIVPTRRKNGLFWTWIVLFIVAMVWFCGWGFGGYGGWWWARSPALTQPGYTAPGTAGAHSGNGSATPSKAGSGGTTTPQPPANAPPPK